MSTGQKGRLIRNSLYSAASYGSGLLLNLLITPLLVFYLGVEGYGIYALLTGLFGYFSLLDFGLGQGVIRYVAHYLGLKDSASAHQSINAALAIQTVAGLIGLMLLWSYSTEIVYLLNIGQPYHEEARTGVLISAAGFFLTMVLGNFSFVLQGMQQYDAVGKTNTVFSVLTALAVAATLLAGGRLLEVVVVSVVVSSLNAGTFLILTRRSLPEYRPSLRLHLPLVREIARYSGFVFVSRISNVLNTYFLRFLISAFWGPQAVTYFVVPMKLVSAVQGGLGSLCSTLFPFASQASSEDRLDDLKRIYEKASTYLASLSVPLFLFLILFSKHILSVWMGAEFAEKAWVIQSLLGGAMLLSSFTMVPTNAVLGLGRSREIALFSSGVVVLNLGFCIAFTAWWEAQGTAAGVLMTQLLAIPFVWFSTKYIIGVDWRHYVRRVYRVQELPLVVFLILGLALASMEITLQWKAGIIPAVVGMLMVAGYVIILHLRSVISLNDFLFLLGSGRTQQK